MKSEGKLGRNWLKEALGDALHATLCGASHNLRLRLFYAPMRVLLLGMGGQQQCLAR